MMLIIYKLQSYREFCNIVSSNTLNSVKQHLIGTWYVRNLVHDTKKQGFLD